MKNPDQISRRVYFLFAKLEATKATRNSNLDTREQSLGYLTNLKRLTEPMVFLTRLQLQSHVLLLPKPVTI